jgi:hypothetical protein
MWWKRERAKQKKSPHHDVREIFDSAMMKPCVKN